MYFAWFSEAVSSCVFSVSAGKPHCWRYALTWLKISDWALPDVYCGVETLELVAVAAGLVDVEPDPDDPEPELVLPPPPPPPPPHAASSAVEAIAIAVRAEIFLFIVIFLGY
jgi:hypothetical protein